MNIDDEKDDNEIINDTINNEDDKKDIEVVIGDTSDLNFSEVENFVEELKPKSQKKSNIIIPIAKDKDKEKNKK